MVRPVMGLSSRGFARVRARKRLPRGERATADPAPSARLASLTASRHVGGCNVNLSSIRVLWRQSDTLALYGIPYDMRPGQSPADLTKGSPSLPYGTYGTPGRAPGPRSDWTWLGSPGWWGSYSRDEIDAIEAFLKAQGDNVPSWPNEWSVVS